MYTRITLIETQYATSMSPATYALTEQILRDYADLIFVRIVSLNTTYIEAYFKTVTQAGKCTLEIVQMVSNLHSDALEVVRDVIPPPDATVPDRSRIKRMFK